jgi:hypothetical protein
MSYCFQGVRMGCGCNKSKGTKAKVPQQKNIAPPRVMPLVRPVLNNTTVSKPVQKIKK